MTAEIESLSTESLLAAILPDRHRDALRPFVRPFLAIPTFWHFVRDHAATIRRELRNQTTLEDCLDVVAELEFACLLSPYVARFDYQYKLKDTGKCLDFVLHFPSSVRVGVEVKRIREPDSVTALHGHDYFEIPYTQKESFKFTDRILEALPQLHPEYPNVLFIQISSTTHDSDDAFDALIHLVDHFRQGNDAFFAKKNFQSRDDFLRQYRKLSAVVVRNDRYPHHVPGCGPNNYTPNRLVTISDAALALPHELAEHFRYSDIST